MSRHTMNGRPVYQTSLWKKRKRLTTMIPHRLPRKKSNKKNPKRNNNLGHVKMFSKNGLASESVANITKEALKIA